MNCDVVKRCRVQRMFAKRKMGGAGAAGAFPLNLVICDGRAPVIRSGDRALSVNRE